MVKLVHNGQTDVYHSTWYQGRGNLRHYTFLYNLR